MERVMRLENTAILLYNEGGENFAWYLILLIIITTLESIKLQWKKSNTNNDRLHL